MSKNSTLEAMLKQYEQNSSSKSSNNTKKEYDLKNYFTTFLKDKENEATKRIRIIPTTDGTTPFKEIWGHKIQVEGEWKTFICPKHEKNEDCPFCEAHDALRATGDEAKKELAKKYNARRMYVVKVVDREKEEEGIKFWRFNHDYRKQGILDKIHGVLKAVQQNITDPKTGRDLMVFIARDQNKKPVVSTISHVDPSPLSSDADLEQEWLNDTRTWEDVYAVKPYDYLEIIVKGGVPVWDKEASKFVDKSSVSEESDNLEEEVTLGVPNVRPNVVAATTATVTESSDNDEDDDLPF